MLINDSIHITHWGDVGPKLVLIHGSAQGSIVGGDTCFSNQKSLAARGFQLVIPDRPGHGKSPAPGRPDDAQLDGQWIAELFDDHVHVVGHSFGGACALNAVSRRPEKVRSLTLIEPAMFTLVMDDARVRKFVLGLLATKFFSFSPTRRVRGFAKRMHIPTDIHGGASDEELIRMDKGLSQLKLPTKAALGRELGIIKEARVPLLVVTGGWNPAFTAVGDRVSTMGGGRHVIVPSPHHFPQLATDQFNELLITFVQANA